MATQGSRDRSVSQEECTPTSQTCTTRGIIKGSITTTSQYSVMLPSYRVARSVVYSTLKNVDRKKEHTIMHKTRLLIVIIAMFIITILVLTGITQNTIVQDILGIILILLAGRTVARFINGK
jgi:hypothetical protein